MSDVERLKLLFAGQDDVEVLNTPDAMIVRRSLPGGDAVVRAAASAWASTALAELSAIGFDNRLSEPAGIASRGHETVVELHLTQQFGQFAAAVVDSMRAASRAHVRAVAAAREAAADLGLPVFSGDERMANREDEDNP